MNPQGTASIQGTYESAVGPVVVTLTFDPVAETLSMSASERSRVIIGAPVLDTTIIAFDRDTRVLVWDGRRIAIASTTTDPEVLSFLDVIDQAVPAWTATPRRAATTAASSPGRPDLSPRARFVGAANGSATHRANRVAAIVEGAAWCYLVLGVLGGLIVAVQTRPTESGFGEVTRPFVAAGVAIMATTAFQALVVIMVAAYIQSRTE